MRMQRIRTGWLLAIALTASTVAQAQDTVNDATGKPTLYTYLALALALLALIGLVLLWWQNRLGWEKISTDRQSATSSASSIRELSNRVKSLEGDNKALVTKMKALEGQLAQLGEQSIVRSDSRQTAQSIPAPIAESNPATQQPEPRRTEPAPVPAASQSQRAMPVNTLPAKLYARTVDVPGGFSVGSLVETPNRPMVFVITPTGPGQATFRVTDDAEAQRLALSDPYSYLSDACNYHSRPEANSRIHMISDGKLQLQGEKWHILEKAEISFYA